MQMKERIKMQAASDTPTSIQRFERDTVPSQKRFIPQQNLTIDFNENGKVYDSI